MAQKIEEENDIFSKYEEKQKEITNFYSPSTTAPIIKDIAKDVGYMGEPTQTIVIEGETLASRKPMHK